MKNIFRMQKCHSCNKTYDKHLARCPFCGQINKNYSPMKFENRLSWLDPIRQIGLFFLLVLGTQLIAVVFILLIQLQDKTLTNLLVNTLTYIVTFLSCLSILFIYKNQIFNALKDKKGYIWGLILGLVLISSSITINSAGITLYLKFYPDSDVVVNTNQTGLVEMIKYSPILSLIIFGLIGPICEELGYRLGLFTFLSRFNRLVAYVGSALIFGFIHFNYTALPGPELTLELISIVNYIAAGLILGVIYENFGLTASITAHVLNNTISILANAII